MLAQRSHSTRTTRPLPLLLVLAVAASGCFTAVDDGTAESGDDPKSEGPQNDPAPEPGPGPEPEPTCPDFVVEHSCFTLDIWTCPNGSSQVIDPDDCGCGCVDDPGPDPEPEPAPAPEPECPDFVVEYDCNAFGLYACPDDTTGYWEPDTCGCGCVPNPEPEPEPEECWGAWRDQCGMCRAPNDDAYPEECCASIPLTVDPECPPEPEPECPDFVYEHSCFTLDAWECPEGSTRFIDPNECGCGCVANSGPESCWGAWRDECGMCRAPNDGAYPEACCADIPFSPDPGLCPDWDE